MVEDFYLCILCKFTIRHSKEAIENGLQMIKEHKTMELKYMECARMIQSRMNLKCNNQNKKIKFLATVIIEDTS